MWLFTAACVASSWYSHGIYFSSKIALLPLYDSIDRKNNNVLYFKSISFNNIIVLKHRADVLNKTASQCLCSVFQAQGVFVQA